MASENLLQSWAITANHLIDARNNLSSPSNSSNAELYAHFIAEFEGYLEHNELELALDALEEASDYTQPRLNFWQNMILAAENMKLVSKTARFRERVE